MAYIGIYGNLQEGGGVNKMSIGAYEMQLICISIDVSPSPGLVRRRIAG